QFKQAAEQLQQLMNIYTHIIFIHKKLYKVQLVRAVRKPWKISIRINSHFPIENRLDIQSSDHQCGTTSYKDKSYMYRDALIDYFHICGTIAMIAGSISFIQANLLNYWTRLHLGLAYNSCFMILLNCGILFVVIVLIHTS
ncbi:hypothetical protein ACJX0J_025314, partial [Zea mays]